METDHTPNVCNNCGKILPWIFWDQQLGVWVRVLCDCKDTGHEPVRSEERK